MATSAVRSQRFDNSPDRFKSWSVQRIQYQAEQYGLRRSAGLLRRSPAPSSVDDLDVAKTVSAQRRQRIPGRRTGSNGLPAEAVRVAFRTTRPTRLRRPNSTSKPSTQIGPDTARRTKPPKASTEPLAGQWTADPGDLTSPNRHGLAQTAPRAVRRCYATPEDSNRHARTINGNAFEYGIPQRCKQHYPTL